MRQVTSDPAARGLMDDTAVLPVRGEALVLTHDMMAEGVHFLEGADPGDVAWKLVAANLSDLAAKGAEPLGILLGFPLGDEDWDKRFAEGLKTVLQTYQVPLLGGDTISGEAGRVLGLTAIGRASHMPVPSRSGAQAGDGLYVTGHVGDALAGFELILADHDTPKALLKAFCRPEPKLSEGQKLAAIVSAMMDVSDGVLLDAKRMAQASGLAISIDLATLPLSDAYISVREDTVKQRLKAATWGDDYQLLFALADDITPPVPATCIGKFERGEGVFVHVNDTPVDLPDSLGFEHS